MFDLIVLLFLCVIGVLFVAGLIWNVYLFVKVWLPAFREIRKHLQ